MNITNISASALRVGQTKMDVTAHNVANAMTPNFKEKNVLVSDTVNGGVKVDSIRDAIGSDIRNQVDNNNFNNNSSNEQFNDVSLEKQIIDLKQQEAYMQLNAKVLKTSDNMLGSLINTFA